MLNNPLLKINLITQDRLDSSVKLQNTAYEIEGFIEATKYVNSSDINRVNMSGTPNRVHADNEGLAVSYFDRTIGNQEMKYEIRQVEKQSGYEWIKTNPIELKVLYDAEGKIDTPVISRR